MERRRGRESPFALMSETAPEICAMSSRMVMSICGGELDATTKGRCSRSTPPEFIDWIYPRYVLNRTQYAPGGTLSIRRDSSGRERMGLSDGLPSCEKSPTGSRDTCKYTLGPLSLKLCFPLLQIDWLFHSELNSSCTLIGIAPSAPRVRLGESTSRPEIVKVASPLTDSGAKACAWILNVPFGSNPSIL